MNIIICGAGRVGSTIAKLLIEQNQKRFSRRENKKVRENSQIGEKKALKQARLAQILHL
jgi:Trk K+ transport system NAD-binding subunit